MQRYDVLWLLFILAMVLAFSIWGLPYFTQLGHSWWSVLVYAFFLVLFLYGRANRQPRPRGRRKLEQQK